MSTTLRKFALVAAAVAAGLTFAADAKADLIIGDATLTAGSVTTNTGSLATATIITFHPVPGNPQPFILTVANGDYATIPLGTFFSSTTLDLTDATTYALTSVGGFGTFTGSTINIDLQNANFLNVTMQGTYSGLTGFDPTPTTLRFAISRSGVSISGSGTLESVPEPSSVILSAVGLVGLAGLAARKRIRATA